MGYSLPSRRPWRELPGRLGRYRATLSLALLALLLGTCGRVPAPTTTSTVGSLYLHMEPSVAGAPLALNTTSYPNGNGEQFTVSLFKFYVSNVKLQKSDGTQYAVPDSYYLVDAATPASLRLALPDVPPGIYTGVSFVVGVDSARNVAGVQVGALDPVNGMFWDWNTGYIFMRLEGTSPASTTGRLLFAIRGFERPYNTLRTIVPALGGGQLAVGAGHQPVVHLHVDVQKMFAGPSPVRFADVYDSEGGPSSVKVADNYAAGMFTLDAIEAN